MSKKTVGDLRNFEGKQPKAVREFLEHNNLLDALVNPDFIVTADRIDAGCARQLGCEGAPPSHWNEMPESEKEAWRFKLRLGMEEAGGIVPDEVVEVSNDDGDPCPKSIIFWVPGDEEYSFVDLRVGDTLHVVRGEG